MKLSKKQKRVLISLPIVFILGAGAFPLFEWVMRADSATILKAFHTGLAAASGGTFLYVLSLIFNWPMNLKDDK